MLLHFSQTNDPFLNLAIEEVLFRESKEEHVLLYINDPAVIIGKHQAAHMEADTRFITNNNIPVIRRISGGGTVFHDRGNLNFTFIRNSEEGKQVDFRKYTQPVIDFLRTAGIPANFEGKNDIRIEGLKISGNAEHVFRNRVLHHGTLLFSSALDLLKGSIRNDKSHYSTRAVNSNPASVMNLSEKLSYSAGISDLADKLTNFFCTNIPGLEITGIPDEYFGIASGLAASKYHTWEWNYAYGPGYDFSNTFKYGKDTVTCKLSVKDGIVRHCAIEGSGKLRSISAKLTGCRHMVDDFGDLFAKEYLPFSENEIFNFF